MQKIVKPLSVASVVAATLLYASSGAQEFAAETRPLTDPGTDMSVVYVYGTRETYREKQTSSATRTPTPLEELPQSVFVITRDVMDDQGMTGLGELVRYVPGITMGQGEGHRDAPVFRGNLTTSDFFVDGVRDDLQYLRDLYNVERVDVVKGAAALVFGRGTGGGALNRVTKSADGESVRALDVTFGMYDQSRLAADWGGKLSDSSAGRLNVMVEESEGYRDAVDVSRRGVAPAWGLSLSERTRLELVGEYFSDERTVDRGVPSQAGRPWRGSTTNFFGNPELSKSDIEVVTTRGALLHEFDNDWSMRVVISYGDYYKFYDNVYADGPVDPMSNTSKIASYLVQTDRDNLLAQVDFVWQGEWAGLEHTLLLGFEAGRQESINLRINTASAVFSLDDRGRNFRPDFSIAPALDNRNELDLAAVLLQNQVTLSPTLNAVVGVRWDSFDLIFDDLRPRSVDFARKDDFVSPRLGLVWEPVEGLSVYGGWSQAYLPQSGEQFNSLNATLAALEPEEFESFEIGLRWQPSPDLLLSAALYQLDRANTRAPGATAGTTVLTGSQRSEGLELGVQGKLREGWNLIGAMALQDVKITSTTAAAPAGREVPLVSAFSASLWNRVSVAPKLDLALGVIHQGEQFASITNAVTLPSYTRVDAAAFYRVSERFDVQLNIENLTDETYWFTAHNDNNITPGSGVLARVTVSARF